MAYGMDDRVREQATFAGGTGAVTLTTTPVSGFQSFLSGWGASGTGEYCLVIGAQWETGFGTLNAGGTLLTRTAVYDGSSGAGVAVNFSAGTMDCFGNIPAELTHHLNMREIAVASAATCDIGAVRGSSIEISGVVTITSFGTSANRRRFVRFSGALTLTHNGTSLILPGAANIVTVAGDTAVFVSDASGNWRCLSYQRGANLPFSRVVHQRITASGTYTPTVGMIGCIIEVIGGGGGGGSAAGTASNVFAGGGGGGGSYSRKYATAAAIGVSQVVTIGAGGTGGAAGSNAGAAGGDTSVGTICIGKGGGGGQFSSAVAFGAGGAGGIAGTGDFTPPGSPGIGGVFNAVNTTIAIVSGGGGSSLFGGGATGSTGGNGAAATGYGGGGAGGFANGAVNAAGGNGFAGVVIITEFVK